jgi:hypothetical protein
MIAFQSPAIAQSGKSALLFSLSQRERAGVRENRSNWNSVPFHSEGELFPAEARGSNQSTPGKGTCFFTKQTHCEKLRKPCKSMRNAKTPCHFDAKNKPIPALRFKHFHSSLLNLIQGYSTPFNPIQGVFEKKIVRFYGRDARYHDHKQPRLFAGHG